MPMSVTSTAARIVVGVRRGAGRKCAISAQRRTVVADPQVPGPGRRWPMPKRVAVTAAHRGGRNARATAGGTPALRSLALPSTLLIQLGYYGARRIGSA